MQIVMTGFYTNFKLHIFILFLMPLTTIQVQIIKTCFDIIKGNRILASIEDLEILKQNQNFPVKYFKLFRSELKGFKYNKLDLNEAILSRIRNLKYSLRLDENRLLDLE